MARMHCRSKGVSESTLPYNIIKPTWQTMSKEEIENIILGLARKGHKPSEIGKIMRDMHGIGRVKHATGRNVLEILRMNDQAPTIPEDLEALLNKCISIRSHLVTFKNDKRAKYNLGLLESRMYRLARYFKKNNVISKDWKPYVATK